MPTKAFYQQSIAQVLEEFQGEKRRGLISSDVERRKRIYGANEIQGEKRGVSKIKVFLIQWKSPLLLLLLVAGGVSIALQELGDGIIILFTAFINAIIGFFQEYKASQALKKLQSLITHEAVVIRDTIKQRIKSTDIVPGDILLLEAGDSVQADGRIINSVDLVVNEALLTGESEPVQKHSDRIESKIALAERKNMVFRGTTIVSGRATVVVTAIGKATEIGQIASLVSTTKETLTPLQQQLARLSRIIAAIVVFICIGIFLLGLFQSRALSPIELFKTSVAVSVAAIPEGLVISLTVILAIGMQRILKRNALVRKMVAAETLGSVSVICTDKTGTLTEGKMKVGRLITINHDLEKEISILDNSEGVKYTDECFLLKIGALCNDAHYEKKEEKQVLIGDTTDIAFLEALQKVGLKQNTLEETFPRIAEIPFDSQKKYMATLHSAHGGSFICIKGAPELILPRTTQVEKSGKSQKWKSKEQEYFYNKIQECTQNGLRVIGIAYKKIKGNKTELLEEDLDELTFVGMVALSDPLRTDVQETIRKAQQASIRVVMITGDHIRTAQYIAKNLQLPAAEENIINGEELQKLNEIELKALIERVSVFARVDPKDKIRIVQAFQKRGEVVAMTGDGVNDSPALKGADIGIAVGSGTDIAKDIADVVLLDDKFSTIVATVEEGRKMYQNMKKVLLYLFAFSLSEVFIVTGSILMGLPLPILPAQILWINLVQDSLPAIALAFEKSQTGLMKEKPRQKNESIFDSSMKIIIAAITVVSNVTLFSLFLFYYKSGAPLDFIRTMMFGGLGISSFFFIYSVKSLYRPLWSQRLFDNAFLNLSIFFGGLMLVGAMYIPLLQELLQTVPLKMDDWIILGVFGMMNLFIVELIKYVKENLRGKTQKRTS